MIIIFKYIEPGGIKTIEDNLEEKDYFLVLMDKLHE